MPANKKQLARPRKPLKTKRPVGRPPKFSKPEELERAVLAYFEGLKIDDVRSEPPTLAGLMLHLDFAEYRTLHDYEAKPEFTQVLKKARLRIISAHERQLFGTGCTGSIFYLKCHGGDMFREQAQRHEHNVRGGAMIVPGVMTPESWEAHAKKMKELGPPPMDEADGDT